MAELVGGRQRESIPLSVSVANRENSNEILSASGIYGVTASGSSSSRPVFSITASI